MGFGTDLQGRASHDALLHLQDTEIRLLETFKKCVTQRIYADKEYAAALGNVVNTATKLDIQQYDSPVFKAWDTIVKQTEALQKVMQQNTDRMCTKTLESLITLINDKRTTRKTYADERQRLEVEFAKLQEDVQKSKGEYERVMEKVSHDRAKYEDLHRKGKLTSKFEEARTKYSKSTGKLHRAHNDYILLLREVTNHQKHYLQNTLPSLLEYQETCLQNLVKQCQDVFRDYAELTDSSSSPHAQCHRCISNSIAAINYKEEYSDFLSKHKSDKLEASKFEFDRNIMDVYKGNLVADQVALDDTTFENLKHRQKTLQERLDGIKQKKDNKTKEMNEINVQLAQQAASEYNNDATTKAARNAKEKTWQVLNREVTELQCQESKTQVLLDVVSRSVKRVGDGEPPKAIELAEAPPPPEPDPNNPSQSNAVASPGAAAIGSLGKKLGGLKSTISNMKMPFNKQTSHTPPKPPSKDFLTSNHQPSTSEDNLNRPYEDETISPGATNNHVGEGPPERLEEQPWFHGVLPREEVQRLLINQGDYLVRESRNKKTGETQYVLSVMWNGYKHFIIQGGDGNWRFEGESRGTIPELIAVQHDSNHPVTNKSQAILKTAIVKETWELNNDDIETCEKIGNGNFGDVFRGIYKPDKLEVAVKTCRETLSEEAKKKFLQEGRILKQYDHPNIVKFVGIAATRQPVMIVMEYVPGGALLNFLKKRGNDQTVRQLVRMCLDAAAGMNYLESKNCIHRDLAARNCLVGKNNSVKISDFGMSREEEEYTVSDGLKQIPIKWTAPEALNFGKYTSLCDVWSFGILMWEVFSAGATPYAGMTNNQAREKIDTGYRLPSPEGTPEIVYKLMKWCWEYEADDRPHFEGIHAELEKIVKLF